MVKQLDEIITQTKTALTLINRELQHIPGVASDTRRTLAKTRRLLDSVQNTWPLSGNSSTSIPQLLILPPPSYD